jgi:hypothetical protein
MCEEILVNCERGRMCNDELEMLDKAFLRHQFRSQFITYRTDKGIREMKPLPR